MYPTIADFINELLGTDLSFPAQTFGFFVAMAFLAAYQVLRYDMVEREKLGQFKLEKVKVRQSGPIQIGEVFIQTLIWGIIGYKLGYGFDHWTEFSTQPQEVILSTKGSLLWALGFAAVGGGIKFWQFRKLKATEEKFDEMELGPSQHLTTIVTIAFVAGLLGAKIFHNLEYFDEFKQDPMGHLMAFDGLTFYGGLITAGGIICWFLLKKGYNLLHMLDIFAPCLILAYAVGRIGCQMAGDGDWGIVNDNPMPEWLSFLPQWIWAFDYPNNVNRVCNPYPSWDPNYLEYARCNWAEVGRLVKPVYPTPFYETTICLMIFGLLWFLRKRLKYVGQLCGIYFFLNGMERFFIEKIRVNALYHIGSLEITQAEIIAIGLMLLGAALFVYGTFFYKRSPYPNAEKDLPASAEAQTE